MIALLVPACVAARPAPTGAPARVLSLHDTATEIVVGLGAAERLVAITEPRFLSPAAAAAVAAVPHLPGGPLSAEALLAREPDLVVGTDVVAEQQPELVAALAAAGRPPLLIDPAGFAGLWAAIEELGERLGRAEAARDWRAELEARLPSRFQGGGPPVRVLFYDCCDPPFVAGGRAPVSELLERLGGRNVFAGLDQDWATVSWEAIAAADPEVIVVHDYPWAGQGDLAAKRDRLAHHPLVARTAAGRRGAMPALPLALVLEGPRTLEAAAPLSAALAEARAARAAGPVEAPGGPAGATSRRDEPIGGRP